jgi:dTDP-4-dehydrorhamnose 3,5-epimerase
MIMKPCSLQGAYEITLQPMEDYRGHFTRIYDHRRYNELGLAEQWVQENRSFSKHKGTIRGLHLQFEPYAETKLIWVSKGAIFDVFVDVRRNSPTFGSWDSILLTESNHKMVYIPRGFAHGFCTLTDDCEVVYKVDNYYSPAHEGGFIWNDASLRINWPILKPILSEKDKKLPALEEFIKNGKS